METSEEKVQASVQDIADDLIKLYAEREAEKGYAFSADDEMRREFEEAFPYQETEDQLRSISEIKKDMERPRPMDRLLVGDVGYGKTEVALRCFQSDYGWQTSRLLSSNHYFSATTF